MPIDPNGSMVSQILQADIGQLLSCALSLGTEWLEGFSQLETCRVWSVCHHCPSPGKVQPLGQSHCNPCLPTASSKGPREEFLSLSWTSSTPQQPGLWLHSLAVGPLDAAGASSPAQPHCRAHRHSGGAGMRAHGHCPLQAPAPLLGRAVLPSTHIIHQGFRQTNSLHVTLG